MPRNTGGLCAPRAAGKMLSAMNLSADPCADFYEFSCGRWRQSNPVPEDEPQVSVFHTLKLDVDIKMASTLRPNGGHRHHQRSRRARAHALPPPSACHVDMLAETHESDLPIFRKVKSMFRLCNNDSALPTYHCIHYSQPLNLNRS